jgi:hypothetical protein
VADGLSLEGRAGDALGDAVHQTRMIRFGLEAIWNAVDALPDGAYPGGGDEGIKPALATIRDWLVRIEEGGLREHVLTRNFSVIKPLSPASPPDAGAVADIAAAIAVLDSHGLIIANE